MSMDRSDIAPDARRWRATPRQQVVGRSSARRSAHVVLLKYLLFGLSAAMVAAIVIWPQFTARQNGQPLDFSDIAQSTPNSTMNNARFVSGGERAVNVTADQVIQDSVAPSIVHLTRIEGDTTTEDGVWMHLSASSGQFDRESQLLSLNGDVALFTDQGNELHSQDAVINLAAGEIDGGGPVSGHGPYGRFRADRFEIREQGNVLVLNGGVQLVIEPGRGGN